jgi:hypothetical protein
MHACGVYKKYQIAFKKFLKLYKLDTLSISSIKVRLEKQLLWLSNIYF